MTQQERAILLCKADAILSGRSERISVSEARDHIRRVLDDIVEEQTRSLLR